METKLTLGSLFDGSGGFPLGGMLAGITPVWASEVEPFAVRVTTKRLPFMKHYGDISTLHGAELEPVDIITFGSPCQDMSIAGKRSGLDGSRSSLFYEAIRIVKEMREKTDGEKPRWICWENVPGAFSSNGGDDFRAVLETVIGVKEPNVQVPAPGKDGWPYADCYVGDGWSVAYRTIDAQHWGVPQRRRRIFLVADFAGGSAGQILFESEGVSGYSAEGFRAWQRAARSSTAGLGAAGGICLNDQGGSRMDITEEVTCTLRAESHHPPCIVPLEHHPLDSRIRIETSDTIQTLTNRMGTGGNNVPLLMEEADTPKTLKIRSGCAGGGKGALIQEDKSATLSCNNDQTVFVPKVYGICSLASNAMQSDNPRSGIYEAETTRTLDASGGNPVCNQGGMAVVGSYSIQGSMIGRSEENGPQGDGINENVSFTLNTADRHAVYMLTTGSFAQVTKDTSPTLLSRDWKQAPVVTAADYFVRRLTPTECARLQGFPDWWCADLGVENPTEDEIEFWSEVWEIHRKVISGGKKAKTRAQIIKWLKAPHTDAAEYKLWGNGVALPCVFFVLAGIAWASTQDDN
jgi:DNA (cytosine-5)-methyltransferase 1